jgi:hypothetical protein
MRPCRALAGAAVPSAPGQDERRPGVIRGSPKNTSRDGSLREPPGASSAAPASPLSGSGRGLSARGQISAAYQSVRPWCDTSATVSSSSRRCFVRKRSVSNHRLIAEFNSRQVQAVRRRLGRSDTSQSETTGKYFDDAGAPSSCRRGGHADRMSGGGNPHLADCRGSERGPARGGRAKIPQTCLLSVCSA